jgi:hypothetical protein
MDLETLVMGYEEAGRAIFADGPIGSINQYKLVNRKNYRPGKNPGIIAFPSGLWHTSIHCQRFLLIYPSP